VIEELVEILNNIKDRELREIVKEIIQKPIPSLKTKGVKGTGIPLRDSPAAKYQHHSYPKGLVEHIAGTAAVALALCDSVEKVYGGRVDRDLVLAGVLLHDIFKPITYVQKEDGRYGSSTLGERLDHLTLILGELYKRKAPLELLHVIAAHHGKLGPISPRTVEALVVHIADFADATLNGEILDAAHFLVRDCTGGDITFSSSKDAFDIIYAKQKEGCKGVEASLKRIKKKRKCLSTC
jgi:7,8-dihydroneopterin 2',3'-cyclic phosphate phosphodiesterase